MRSSAKTIVMVCVLTSTSIIVSGCGSIDVDRNGETRTSESRLTTMALRVHRMDAMVRFYSEAFGAKFREVKTGKLGSRFGRVGNIQIKLVPLRPSTDFVGYPSHQPGFIVDDVRRVIALAERYGGRQEGDMQLLDGQRHGAVRDPDGNTIELYERRP